MASLIARGQAALALRQKAAAAPEGTVTYHRVSDGATVDLTGKCWIGRTPFRVEDRAAGQVLRGDQVRQAVDKSRLVWSDRDYLLAAADLAVASVAFTPAAGDWFEEVLASGTKVYKVFPYASEPEWRYSDPQHTVLRVHTKLRA